MAAKDALHNVSGFVQRIDRPAYVLRSLRLLADFTQPLVDSLRLFGYRKVLRRKLEQLEDTHELEEELLGLGALHCARVLE